MPVCYRHPDRETGLSCSDCGRPICTDCVTFAPVGLRCPDHAGGPSGPSKVVRAVQRPAARRGIVLTGDAIVTKILIAANVLVYLITVTQGAGMNDPGGEIFYDWLLFGPLVADGEWWRLITSTVLHAGLIHIAMNMLALAWLGSAVERTLGKLRFTLVYVVSGLAGSAGVLVFSPTSPTVGASGAIFGLLGAGLVLEWRATGKLGGQFAAVIAVNLAITFGLPGISIGGHVGGLLGGILAAAALVLLPTLRGPRVRGVDVLSVVGVAAVGIVAVAITLIEAARLT